MAEYITREQFIIMLSQSELSSASEELISAGIFAGWLESEDSLFRDKFIERRNVARIVHSFLLKVLKEQEIEDITPATMLKDLYDCRVCANHIAQVYAKGIMEACKDNVFGLTEKLSAKDAQIIVDRVYDLQKRVII